MQNLQLKHQRLTILFIIILFVVVLGDIANAQDTTDKNNKSIILTLARGYMTCHFFCSDDDIPPLTIKDEAILFPPTNAECSGVDNYKKVIEQFYKNDSSIVPLMLQYSLNNFDNDTLIQKYLYLLESDTWKYEIDGNKSDDLNIGVTLRKEQINALIFLYSFLTANHPNALQIPVKKNQNKNYIYIFTPEVIADWVSKNWGSTKYMRAQFQKTPPKFTCIDYIK